MTSRRRFGHASTRAASSGAALDHLLEVVEDEQHLALADVVGEAVLGAERLPIVGEHERRVADRRQARPRTRRP